MVALNVDDDNGIFIKAESSKVISIGIEDLSKSFVLKPPKVMCNVYYTYTTNLKTNKTYLRTSNYLDGNYLMYSHIDCFLYKTGTSIV